MKVLFRNFSKIQLKNLKDSIDRAIQDEFDTYDVSFDVEGYANTDLVTRTGTSVAARLYGRKELPL